MFNKTEKVKNLLCYFNDLKNSKLSMTLSSWGVHDNNGGGCESNFLPYIFFIYICLFFIFYKIIY